MRRAGICGAFTALLIIPIVESIIVVALLISMTKNLRGTSLIIIEKIGHEISYFLPSLLNAENAYVMVISRNETNTSSVGSRFTYVCYSLPNLKKCLLNNPKQWTTESIAGEIKYVCNKYGVNNIITYGNAFESSLEQKTISSAAVSLLDKDENERYSNRGMKALLENNITHHGYRPETPNVYLYNRVKGFSINKFMKMYKDTLLGKIIMINPLQKIDDKMTSGINFYPVANILVNEKKRKKILNQLLLPL